MIAKLEYYSKSLFTEVKQKRMISYDTHAIYDIFPTLVQIKTAR